jgi:hypothetical protein
MLIPSTTDGGGIGGEEGRQIGSKGAGRAVGRTICSTNSKGEVKKARWVRRRKPQKCSLGGLFDDPIKNVYSFGLFTGTTRALFCVKL